MPCCLHTFTDRFTRGEYSIDERFIATLPEIAKEDIQTFGKLSGDNRGRYSAYLNYIAEITMKSGWRIEREALRVPSTKNWAFVGRHRIWRGQNDEEAREEQIKRWIKEIAKESLKTWKPRAAEGKDH